MSSCSVESGRNEITKSKFRYEGFPGGSMVKNLPASAEDTGSIPRLGRPLEKGMAAHSSYLVWKIPWTEKPVGLQSLESQKNWTQLSD